MLARFVVPLLLLLTPCAPALADDDQSRLLLEQVVDPQEPERFERGFLTIAEVLVRP